VRISGAPHSRRPPNGALPGNNTIQAGKLLSNDNIGDRLLDDCKPDKSLEKHAEKPNV
jgi:hypothetical protein